MTERVTSVAPETQLDAISAALVGEGIGGVPVVDAAERVVGFVSDIDLMNALLRDDPFTTEARAIMSKPPIVIDEFAPCEEVIALLRERRIHHLPVVRAGKLVGIIAPSDVLRFFVEHVLPPPPEVG
jgi:CBS domain-containing protein